ncbi:beta-phosphoglucomutase [Lacrimispora saccharolytica]|uniref:Beta-phosphoglucomutase n=1 Tax=Lacrimispora saccharolytica (strain ATCC 35040 / DSM 2544 / NRCC 2533 / WM1) TaxID=610130 RepID=D9R655_LACSW|nr:beta-phosphoglucomutase [Lacrimispora saccharolytica]ADL03489.1 beta-phosphoglucomutase [[Clostridium] saccharolyticum WM1]QRV18359.1 beta-phosphoglucomutase [Lacrimispora saccharolytica]
MINTMNFIKGQGDLTNWLIEETGFDARNLGKYEAVFAQGNGYIGMRNALEERYVEEVRNTFITGTFNKAGMEEVTELPNIPDVTAMDIYVDGYRLNLQSGTLTEYSRVMNLKNGETVRKIIWESPSGTLVTAVFKRFVSLKNEHVAAQYLELTCDKNAQLVIETGIHGDVTNHGAMHFDQLRRRIHDGVIMQFLGETTESRVVAAVHSACRINREEKALPVMGRRTMDLRWSMAAGAGETIRLEKVSCFHSSRDRAYEREEPSGISERLKADGMECLRMESEKGYGLLMEESEAVWKEYWKDHEVTIRGNADFHQLALRFAQYHLNIMVKKDDNRVGIGAKALTGEGYKGHSFWDTEMFILPYFTLTEPKTARTLLEYRYRNLYGARKKAAENGWEGAMYPWECAWIDDGEVTPLYLGTDVVTGKVQKCLTGLIEHHISADVAYAVWQYYQVSGDQEYMDRFGYEIILDTALFWASRLEWNEKKGCYEILDVIGPDEYKEHVDNNAYTNYMADYNMELAEYVIEALPKENLEVSERLDQKFHFSQLKQRLREKRAKLYLPMPDENGIVPQTDQYMSLEPIDLAPYKASGKVLGIHEDYNMEQMSKLMVSKQADTVMLDFVLPERFSLETKRKNFVFYEDKTLHDSSLSRCVHSILANDYGMEDMALRMHQAACSIDLGPNMKSSEEGIHSASIGGIWLSCVMGFGGVRIRKGNLELNPKLPKDWEELCFPLVWKGRELRISADKKGVRIENNGAGQVALTVFGRSCKIDPGTFVYAEKKNYKAVIFDLDGVICHTDHYHYLAWKEVADELGIYFDESINHRLRGVSRKESFDIILERYDKIMGEEDKEIYLTKKNEGYQKLLKGMTPSDLSEETKNTLLELRKRGMKLAIGSSSKNAGLIIKQLGLEHFFDAVSDGNMITHSKPHPEVFQKAASMVNCEAENCLVVEDAKAGLEAAKAGGMDCAAVGDAVKSPLADYKLSSFRQLLEIVE